MVFPAKPDSEFPQLASAGGTVTEPGTALKQTGFAGITGKPEAKHVNWLFRHMHRMQWYWRDFLQLRPAQQWLSAHSMGGDSAAAHANDFAYSPTLDLYVVVGRATHTSLKASIASSADGETWTNRYQGAAGLQLFGVFWDATNSLFVAYGGTGTVSLVLYSADGTAWTDATAFLAAASPTGAVEAMEYDMVSSLYVCVSETQIFTTPDVTATNWTSRLTAVGRAFRTLSLDPVNGIAIAGDFAGNAYYRSANMTSWSLGNFAGGVSFSRDALWDPINSRFVQLLGDGGSGSKFNVSDDGTSWKAVDADLSDWVAHRMARNPDNGSILLRSQDNEFRAGYVGGPFHKMAKVDDLWDSPAAANNYCRPFWAAKNPQLRDRFWLAGGGGTQSSGNVILKSRGPIV